MTLMKPLVLLVGEEALAQGRRDLQRTVRSVGYALDKEG
jgi:hypothetical protein